MLPAREREKESFSNTPEDPFWQGETSSSEPNLMEYFQSLIDLEEGRYPTATHLCCPVPPKVVENNWEILVTFTSSGIGSLKHYSLILELENAALPSTPYQNVSKGLFIAIPVTHYITSGYRENYKACQKAKKKKKKMEETEQVWEPDMEGMLEL